jgi:DNA-binding NtrC family response regulator
LRERPDDVPVLARHFAEKICRAEGIPLKTIGDSALRKLAAHNWPGNARELENTIESAIIRCGDEPSISAFHLEFQSAAPMAASGEGFAGVQLPTGGIDYQQAVEEFEHALLTQALARTRGNKTAAAALLRLKRTTLSARMRALEARFPRLVA